MHFLPDTEEEDSAAETFWPEGYKKLIREDVPKVVAVRLSTGKGLSRIYQQYSGKNVDLSQFVDKLANMVAIGAENGSDDAFDDIITAFSSESPLPEIRRYARYLRPGTLPEEIGKRLKQTVVEEYGQDKVYDYAYHAGYQSSYRNHDEFFSRIAELVVTGAMNGADDMLAAIYRSFLNQSSLPVARRHPRRLRTWVSEHSHH